MVGHSSGSGSYSATASKGVISSNLTGLYPWARYGLNEQLQVGGAAGYGAGSFTLTPDGRDAIHTDFSLSMAAAGLRGLLIEGGAEGFSLTAKTDVLAVETTTAPVEGLMASSHAGVTRLRLALEGTLPVQLSDVSVLSTSLETGLRLDGGEAETGFGLEMGAAMVWHQQKHGLSAEVRGRGLLTHAAEGFSNRGLSTALSWDPTPASPLGPSFSLSHTMGGAATGGLDALFSTATMARLAAGDDHDGGSGMENRRLELTLAYGLPAFSDSFSLTPQLTVGLGQAGRDYSLTWHLDPLPQDDSSSHSLEVSLHLRRRERDNNDHTGNREHSAQLLLTSHF